MCQEMANEIKARRMDWLDGGNMDISDNENDLGSDIKYEITGAAADGTLKGTIIVGQNTPRITLGNGDQVNPYLFIEFGFGIEGQEHPALYARENQWQYNINQHKNFIIYANEYYNSSMTKEDRKLNTVWTRGTKGINFFYNTTRKYRKIWRDLVSKDIKLAFQQKGIKVK